MTALPDSPELISDENGAEAAEAPAAPPENSKWYVIHTYSGYEGKVKKNLEHRIDSMGMKDKIYQVVVPVENEIEIKNGQRLPVVRKLFPGSVLVNMIELQDDDKASNEAWFVVRNTPGVTSFVGSGSRPIALLDREVASILKQSEAEAPKMKPTFTRGQNVRIIDGPFAEFIGVVDEVSAERNKVKVLVSFFGRETPVELDFLQVEKL
ncbi:MAG: transcription termination/antitermination protein NusG [Acidobacteriaceae bacterium]